MHVSDYYRLVLVPANVAVSAIRRAGLPVDLERINELRAAWTTEVLELERYVEGEAAKVGHLVKYSENHAASTDDLAKFLYDGLGLTCKSKTKPTPKYPQGQRSTADEDLSHYASLAVPDVPTTLKPEPTDHPIVKAILQIRSLSKGVGTYLDSFERTRRADGACHPHFNWALRTARISAENPPVHQIPERADRRVADAIKSIFIPRMGAFRVTSWNPKKGDFGGWDPRIHGSTWRWDISGAEACVRAGMFTYLYGVTDPVAYEYLRKGADIHSKTASLIYNVPEGTYTKGSYERDAVGKTTFFAKQFGAKEGTVKSQIWAKARYEISKEKAKEICANFDAGYSGLVKLYELDKRLLGDRSLASLAKGGPNAGYCEDAYGRRRAIPIPEGVKYIGDGQWDLDGMTWPAERPGYKDPRSELVYRLEHEFHVFANTPTQSTNAIDNHFMLALLQLGEYIPLQVPPIWERDGIPFPEAAGWQLNGGPGPAGKPMLAWHMNTVHDSGWGDSAPGYLEPTGKLVWRRCRAVPLDLRIEADMPYRVDFSVGPDMSNLTSYNVVAKAFGLEPLPER